MPNDPAVEQAISRAKEAFARNQYLAALADLEPLSEAHPEFADVQNLMGLCLALIGRSEEALVAFERAVERNPGYVEAHLNHAITLNDLGRVDEAHAAFARAAEADEAKTGGIRFPSAAAARIANTHAQLGDLYAEAGALQEAVEQYRAAVALRPQFLDIRNKMARVLIDLGEHEQAVAELDAVLATRPSFAAARVNLGLALYRAGRLDDAEREWQRTLAQLPDHAQAASYLGMLQRQREQRS